MRLDYIQVGNASSFLRSNYIQVKPLGGAESPIVFLNSAVKTICATNWGSGGEITPSQAAAVTSAQFGATFSLNTTITAFPELEYFTGLTSIPDNAFKSCTNLAGALNIPANVTTIGAYAFYQCKFTGTLTIPNTVTSIGTYAFRECTGFTGTLTIPASLTTIGTYSFRACTGFTGNLVIPNTVTSLGGFAFMDCTGITGTLTIGTGITTIPQYCFYNGSFTGTLTIPANITTIETYAFFNCAGFTGNLVIPNTVTSLAVGGNQFAQCFGMTGTLTIGTGIASIPHACFSTTRFTGTLTIPPNVTTILGYAFSSSTGLTGNLMIPNVVTSIGDAAFGNLLGMTGTLTIGTGLASIPAFCFNGCKFTGALTIPANVVQILNSAFYTLTTVSQITDQRATPPTLGTMVFSGTFPIYVPSASVAAYEAATNWSAYAARIFGY